MKDKKAILYLAKMAEKNGIESLRNILLEKTIGGESVGFDDIDIVSKRLLENLEKSNKYES